MPNCFKKPVFILRRKLRLSELLERINISMSPLDKTLLMIKDFAINGLRKSETYLKSILIDNGSLNIAKL
jgi:hypothetical protein